MLKNTRNIGISAHIDSGKTTLTERILYYAGRIHKMEEIRGGGSGPKMDFMELEREKGITITSAATTLHWKDTKINLIDTPGHVDFTIEVERALRALDGAVMVLCGVGGVQSQTLTVDRQMKRYRVPRVAFINKLDRMGADPFRVVDQIRHKLDLNPVLLQLPMGLESDFQGLVDLVEECAYTFGGDHGEKWEKVPIPASMADEAQAAREELLDKVSFFSDEMTEKMLEGEPVSSELLLKVLRECTLRLDLVPVLLGSAYKNKGVQNLLDAVTQFLPSPLDREVVRAYDLDSGDKVDVLPNPKGPMVSLAFKLTEEPFGQLTYIRLYSGTLRKGDTVVNSRTGKRLRVGRIVRMHANDRSDVAEASGGDIVALIGVECSSGDTFCSDEVSVSLEGMFVPDPVITLSITPRKQDDSVKMAKALSRFVREDPTFRVTTDPESGETLIAGMGELHLEIYTERMRREYHADVSLGQPKVAYRETILDASEFDYRHRKQTGGAGQYGHVVGRLEPCEEPFVFDNLIVGGVIPKEFIPGCEKGFRDATEKGPLAGYPVTGVRVVLEDGSAHDVDSSELAFRVASRFAFKDAFGKAHPVILEPIMLVEVETPTEFLGTVQGDLSSRRGFLLGSEAVHEHTLVRAEVPLAEMFGYSTDLRSRTQGKATFSMEFARYRQVPSSVQERLIEEAAKARKERQAA